jgi:Flp pilus assembly protein TadG
MAIKQGRQKGLATVEFAIALPLIALIALAVTELGRGLYHYNTLSKAVHDGARFLADDIFIEQPFSDVPTILASNATLVGQTKNLVVSGDVDGGTALLKGLTTGNVTVGSVPVTMSDGGIDNHIVVTATYTFPTLLFPDLSVLGYSMSPTFTVTAVERALKI